MLPLPLLPTVPDSLEHMTARRALPLQNAFMKNALIRAFNLIYDMAPKADASHPSFNPFMEYIEMVCDMISLHLQGDEVFFKSLARHGNGYCPTTSGETSVVQGSLETLRNVARDWKKDGKLYQHNLLQGLMAGMEASLVEVLHKKMPKFSVDVPESISDEELHGLIRDIMVWLGSHSDITILLPFCVSHHDPKTSEYWPSISNDAIQAIPGLVREHSTLWQFAPFDPIKKITNACPI